MKIIRLQHLCTSSPLDSMRVVKARASCVGGPRGKVSGREVRDCVITKEWCLRGLNT